MEAYLRRPIDERFARFAGPALVAAAVFTLWCSALVT